MNGNGSPSQALEQSVTPLGVMTDLGELPAAIPEGFAVSEELPASRIPKVMGSGRGHLGLTAVLEPSASFTGSKGGSRTGSKRQGSQASKSKMTKRTKGSRRSKNSKNPQGIVRRTKKAPTFSSWEAQTYIPPIKKSWEQILMTVSIEQVGVVFYDKLFQVGGHSIEHMFTTEKSIMAVKFAEMLASIVTSVDNPYSMYQKLQGLAPMHIEKGVGKEHLPIMGETLFSVLEDVLQDKFTVQVRTAWEWLWAWLGATFTQSIEECGNEQTVISTSWNLAMDNYPDESLGELLYTTLFELAPNLRAVFSKPKQILSVKFVEMMATLVSFHQKLDDNYNEQLVWLGIRHVAYGAKFSHVDVLAQVLLATISTAVGEDWTEEMEEAWKELWMDTCQRLLTLTNEAEKYGLKVQEMWRVVQQRTTRAAFGSALRKMLLSGTEWVQSLSSRPAVVSEKEEHHADGSPLKPLGATAKRKTSLVSMTKASLANVRKTSTTSMQLGSTTGKSEAGGLDSPSIATSIDEPKDGEKKDGGGESRNDAEVIGTQFWEMLTVILDLLWEPERQNEQLILMTTRFYKCGIRTEHLTSIGQAIETTCRKVLDQTWSQEYKEAWGWFWHLVSCSMTRTFNVLEQKHAEIVLRSWSNCKAKMDTIDLGESIFKELASVAPYLVHLFKRPKRIQAAQFVSAVDLLTSFLEDPDTFFVELRQLTIRHIKYGVKADYAKAFGTAILRGVKNAIGKEEWTAETQAAWEMLWDRVCNCLTRCLNAGTNLVIVSLVNGDLEKAKEAMDCAPRGERFDTLTRVDVNGEVLSPLYWAIRDGMRDIALFLLEDLLTIRADRHSYYYGREKLFETHPDIVEVLCKDPGAEELMDTLFNGLMWHSDQVNQGKLRVNYYIKELYGDPEKDPNAWLSALATLSLHGPPTLFDHPVCVKLLQCKWNAFGQIMFFGIQSFYCVITILYYAAFVVNDERCGANGIVRLIVGVLAVIAVTSQCILAVSQIRSGLTASVPVSYPDLVNRITCNRLPSEIVVPRTLMNIWNVSRIPAFVMLCYVVFSDTCLTSAEDGMAVRSEHGSTMASLVALVVGLQLLEVFMLNPQVASLMLLIQNLLPDVARTLVLCMIFICAFAGALTVYKAVNFSTLGESVSNLISMLLSLDIGLVEDAGAYGAVLITILVVIIQCAVFNILIAQLVNRTASIAQWSHLMVQKKFAYVCVEMESLLPLHYRIKLFKSMGFDEPLDFEVGDDGPSGGIQELEPASIRSDPKYQPDRILRFTGEASASDPWPSSTITEPGQELEREEDDYQGGAGFD